MLGDLRGDEASCGLGWSWKREWLVGHDIVFTLHLVPCRMHRFWQQGSCGEFDWLALDVFSSRLNVDSVLVEVEFDVKVVEDFIVYRLSVAPDRGDHSGVLQHVSELLEQLLELGLVELLLVVDVDLSAVGFPDCLVDGLSEVERGDHHVEVGLDFRLDCLLDILGLSRLRDGGLWWERLWHGWGCSLGNGRCCKVCRKEECVEPHYYYLIFL